MKRPPHAENRRTVESYERYARTYAGAVSPRPTGKARQGLRRLAAGLGPGATVLEVGSGPGFDADYLETLGVAVRRTDVTAAFRELQAERGKRIDRLDVVTDDLGGPHDGVMALCVLLHVERADTARVLGKVARALRRGGLFLVSLRAGEGELWERGASGDYRVVLWTRDAFAASLKAAGLDVDWSAASADADGSWLHFLARRPG